MSEMIHLHSAHTIFDVRRSHLRTQKASKLLAAGALPQTPIGELLQRSLMPLADGEGQKPHPCSQPFGDQRRITKVSNSKG